MNNLSAKELENLFKTFTSDSKKIIPAISNDWYFETVSGYSSNFVNLYSDLLNQSILKIDSNSFLKFVIKNNIPIIGNKIQGSWAISSNRTLEPESLFMQYESLKEENSSKEILKSELIVGKEYETSQKNKFIFLGRRYCQTILLKDTISLSKIKKSYMAFNLKNQTLFELSSKDIIISESSEATKNTIEINDIIKNNILKSKYVFIKDFMPTKEELKYKLVKGTGTNHYSKYLKSNGIECYFKSNYNYYKFPFDSYFKDFNFVTNIEFNVSYNYQERNSINLMPYFTISIDNVC